MQWSQIVNKVNETALVTILGKEGTTTTYTPDLLIISEGARSSTNELLAISRIQVLPKLPVVAAIFRDRTGSLSSIPGRIGDGFTQMYYTFLFLFKMTFGGEHIFNQERRIRGALILPTPGQNYVGFTLDKEKSDQLKELEEQYRKSNDPKIKKERDALLRYWSHLSFCFANALAIASKFYGNIPVHLSVAFWKTLDLEKTSVIEIGADKADRCSGTVGKTAYLIAGDALHTVDPVTGLGASTAIKASAFCKKILEKCNAGLFPTQCLEDYDRESKESIRRIHSDSIAARRAYRPDAVR